MIWTKLDEHLAYKGYRNMVRKTFELPDGKVSDYDILTSPSFVSVAAFTANREAVLVREYRPGPESLLLSFPEGQIGKNESQADAVRRELLEETGFEASDIQYLKSIPEAYTNVVKHIYVATNCQFTNQQQLDHGEFIEVLTLPLEKFRAVLKQSQDSSFTSVDVGYLALDFLGWLV